MNKESVEVETVVDEQRKCSCCGAELPEDSDYKTCKKCRADSRRYYERLKEENRCLKCKEKMPKLRQKVLCCECSKEESNKRTKQYQERKENDQCVVCGEDVSHLKDEYFFCNEYYEKKKGRLRGWYRERHIRQMRNVLEDLPDYMVEQFFQGLKDLDERNSGEVHKDED